MCDYQKDYISKWKQQTMEHILLLSIHHKLTAILFDIGEGIVYKWNVSECFKLYIQLPVVSSHRVFYIFLHHWKT